MNYLKSDSANKPIPLFRLGGYVEVIDSEDLPKSLSHLIGNRLKIFFINSSHDYFVYGVLADNNTFYCIEEKYLRPCNEIGETMIEKISLSDVHDCSSYITSVDIGTGNDYLCVTDGNYAVKKVVDDYGCKITRGDYLTMDNWVYLSEHRLNESEDSNINSLNNKDNENRLQKQMSLISRGRGFEGIGIQCGENKARIAVGHLGYKSVAGGKKEAIKGCEDNIPTGYTKGC